MPNFSHEINCGGSVAGVDEAGRGPWAGPVVAGAVIFQNLKAPRGIHDSKKLNAATRETLYEKISKVALVPDAILVDGNQPPLFTQKTIALVGGDSISTSIAAASIIAKVTRDRMMRELHAAFPHYGWDRNAGYGTALHQERLAQCGVTPHHRRSFAPIRKLLDGQAA